LILFFFSLIFFSSFLILVFFLILFENTCVKTGSKMGYENHEEYGSTGNMIDDLNRFSVQIGMVNASSNYI